MSLDDGGGGDFVNQWWWNGAWELGRIARAIRPRRETTIVSPISSPSPSPSPSLPCKKKKKKRENRGAVAPLFGRRRPNRVGRPARPLGGCRSDRWAGSVGPNRTGEPGPVHPTQFKKKKKKKNKNGLEKKKKKKKKNLENS
ncbi:hypothetical protein Sjap_026458 [Stephania japonica]|uniref:Uncharacterized protein n=1 Tax=Stephania japonica TaxID=461633 RepID=A0AAP0E722_9MAGN